MKSEIVSKQIPEIVAQRLNLLFTVGVLIVCDLPPPPVFGRLG